MISIGVMGAAVAAVAACATVRCLSSVQIGKNIDNKFMYIIYTIDILARVK